MVSTTVSSARFLRVLSSSTVAYSNYISIYYINIDHSELLDTVS